MSPIRSQIQTKNIHVLSFMYAARNNNTVFNVKVSAKDFVNKSLILQITCFVSQSVLFRIHKHIHTLLGLSYISREHILFLCDCKLCN